MERNTIQKIQRIFFIPFEALFPKLNRWKPITGSRTKTLFVGFRKYRGKERTLKDGTAIQKGDKIGEFHFNNISMLDSDNSFETINRLLDGELTALADALVSDPRYKGIKAFCCTTILYPIIARKGLEVYDGKERLTAPLLSFWETNLRNVFTGSRTKTKVRKPKECWISSEKVRRLSDEKRAAACKKRLTGQSPSD